MTDPGMQAMWVLFGICEQLREKGMMTPDDFAAAADRLRSDDAKAGAKRPETLANMEAAAQWLDSQATHDPASSKT